MITLKLYGESHATDGLLQQIYTIFQEAAKAECKRCFIENPPSRQPFRDGQVQAYIEAKPDPIKAIEFIFGKYKTETSVVERHIICAHFMNLMSALTSIKLVCADLSLRSIDLDRRNSFHSIVGDKARLANLSWEKVAKDFGCSIEEAIPIFS